MKRLYTFHETIDLIALAQPLTKADFILTSQPAVEKWFPFLSQKTKARLNPVFKMLSHLLLTLSLYKKTQQHDLVIVRDFLLRPLICFIWLAYPLRKKFCLINTHNVQRAATRRIDAFLFKCLVKLGFKFIILESSAGIDAVLDTVPPDQFFCLPTPFIPATQGRSTEPHGLTLGTIGAYRPEKGIHNCIRHLLEARQKLGHNIIIGTPNTDAVKKLVPMGDPHVTVLDTTEPEAYASALHRCDIILLSYNEKDYYYRDSGVIANALECGCIVVCPNYPVFRAQVTTPQKVGLCFDTELDVIPTLSEAINQLEEMRANINAYAQHRTPERLASIIDQIAGFTKAQTAEVP